MKTAQASAAKILNRVITRDLPLFMVSASYGQQLRNASKASLGFALSKNYVIFRHGTTEVHRDNQEWYKDIPGFIADALDDTRHFKNTQAAIEETEGAIAYFQNNTQIIFFPSVADIEALRTTIASGVLGMILAYWIPLYHEEKLARYDLDQVSYFQSSRAKTEKFFSLAAEASYQLLSSIAKHKAVDANLLKYATHDELVTLLQAGHIPLDALQVRQKMPFLYVEDVLIDNKGMEQYLASRGYKFEQPHQKHVRKLVGTTARDGHIKGQVQIIRSRQDFASFMENNILVAPMTSPEYTSLITKASAIITDEGGILSHAAIMARELNKPCIVGTKFATQLLQNFQEVDLDATKGIVTLL